jgi:hypothetical protein
LTAYLAFLMIAAPCLCCCTPGWSVAAAPTARNEEPVPSCCHRTEPKSPPTNCCNHSEPAPQPSNPEPQDRCPCRDHAGKPAAVSPAVDSVLVRQLTAGTLVPPAYILPVVELIGANLTLADHSEPAGFLSVFDLLHVHHRLRC